MPRHKFQLGHEKVGGREKGTQNKLTEIMKTVKQTVLETFNELQTDPKQNLKAFAKEYPKEFYQIAAKLIPTELTGEITANVIKIVDDTGTDSQPT